VRLLLLIASVLAASAAAQEPLAIGIMRQDGLLIPIAIVNGDRYQPLRRLNNSEWTLWRWSDSTGTPIRVSSPTKVDSHCTQQDAWRTSFAGEPVRPNEAPVRKIGVAVRGGIVEFPVDVLSQPDDASRRVAALVTRLAHDSESQRLAGEANNHLHKIPRSTRAATAVEIEKLWRHTDGAISTYFFQAVKQYPYRAMTSGWIVDNGTALRSRGVRFQMDDDDYKENERLTAAAIVKYNGRILWIAEWHGYESENYIIHEWPQGMRRLVVGGGGC
jgi:hypothetical protein